MVVKDCSALEEFVQAASLIQKQFFEHQIQFGQARAALKNLLVEVETDNPDCRHELKRAAAQIDQEISCEQLKRTT